MRPPPMRTNAITIDKIRQTATLFVSALAIVFALSAAGIEFFSTGGFGLVSGLAAAGALSLLVTLAVARQSSAPSICARRSSNMRTVGLAYRL